MRKFIVVLAIAFLPFSAFASFDINLKYGAKGNAVTELQEFLNDRGYLTVAPTGNFYSLTLSAVKKFQTANNLPSTGYFGPMSRAVANTLLSADIIESEGAETQEVGSITPPPNTDAIDALNKKVEDLNTKLGQVIINTNPIPMSEPAPVPVEDKSKITIVLNSQEKAEDNGTPFGEYVYKVTVLDKKGNPAKGLNVKLVDAPSDNLNPWNEGTLNRVSENALFSYIPTTSGTKVLKFTCGELTETVTIEVK